jgi:hypothetical protein
MRGAMITLFWIHQVVFGMPSAFQGLGLLLRGARDADVMQVIALLLAWIGGTLMWGFASLIHPAAVQGKSKLTPEPTATDKPIWTQGLPALIRSWTNPDTKPHQT